MEFGTADRRKADVAEGVALALGYVGVPPRQPARHGRVRRRRARRRCRRGRAAPGCSACSPRCAAPAPRRPARQPRTALRSRGELARQRALVVVVSDFRGDRDWRRPLLELAGRHEVIASRSATRASRSCPTSGELRLVDPETGRQLRVEHVERDAARRLRRRGRRGAEVARARCSRRPACGTSCCRTRRRLAADADGLPARAADRSDELRVALTCSWGCCSSRWPLSRYVACNLSRRALRRRASPIRRCSRTSIDRSPGWRRHVAGRAAAASRLTTLLVGVARPRALVTVKRENATIVLAIDTSRSMEAIDVRPSRLDGVKQVALKFVDQLPDEVPRRRRRLRHPGQRRRAGDAQPRPRRRRRSTSLTPAAARRSATGSSRA